MVYFYQLFLNTDDVILKLYTRLCQKAKCTLFAWSTVSNCTDRGRAPEKYTILAWHGVRGSRRGSRKNETSY